MSMPDRDLGFTVSLPVNCEPMGPPWTESAGIVHARDCDGLQRWGGFSLPVALLRKFRTKRGLQGRGGPCPLPRGVRVNCPARSDSPAAFPKKGEWEWRRNAERLKSIYRSLQKTGGDSESGRKGWARMLL